MTAHTQRRLRNATARFKAEKNGKAVGTEILIDVALYWCRPTMRKFTNDITVGGDETVSHEVTQ